MNALQDQTTGKKYVLAEVCAARVRAFRWTVGIIGTVLALIVLFTGMAVSSANSASNSINQAEIKIQTHIAVQKEYDKNVESSLEKIETKMDTALNKLTDVEKKIIEIQANSP